MLASSSTQNAKRLLKTSLKHQDWVCRRCRNFSVHVEAELSDSDFIRRNVLLSPAQAVVRPKAQPKSNLVQRPSPISQNPQRLLDRYNNQLDARAEAGRVTDVLKLCLQMKASGIRPNRTTYSAMLQAFATAGLSLEARSTIHDMKAMGIAPDVEEYNYLLHSLRFSNSSAMRDALDDMLADGVTPDAMTYSHIIRRYVKGGNLELAIQILAEMNSYRMAPPQMTAQAIICEALESGFVRLAFDMSESFEQTSVMGLDSEVWTKLLIGCSQILYAEGTERCWNKVVGTYNVQPDEGLCLQVLHTASRHGLPSLAASAIQKLEELGVTFKEYHLAPLLESFAVNGQLKEAFQVIHLLRRHSIEISQEVLNPILMKIQHDPDAVDDAWITLEDLQRENTTDVAAANVIIEATIVLADLQRTVGILKSMPSLGLTPNVKTYSLVLSACVKARHRDLGEKIWQEMKQKSIAPDSEAYENLVLLCLTQSAYEDAFFYLEEMKEHNLKPSYTLYENLIRKCVANGDSRYKLAMEEVKTMGYNISRRLNRFITNGGETDDESSSLELSPDDQFTRSSS